MIPPIIKLKNEQLIRTASSINTSGTLTRTSNNLIYLDIDDAYIHRLFPLLQEKEVKKPNYFGKNLAGAHVSVIYPEETFLLDTTDLGKKYHFKIKELVMAKINLKNYYVLLIDCPLLIKLRNKYGLSDQLNFKNYWIDLHITIGVSQSV
ncbi:hypothetical protein [Legionella maioricensis]|uniref:Swiss Army Knife 2H phosphoesterase domain-containing protein n=1 Tax=Legionella maioricensis TaxID=2896528 RepID=A0A9X2D070_9GAMM|nr:hypothetical protein [Legionella maioricensis]MCL9683986.1 hypothetical protein [Legionella maioricensis]MCL9687969.1 hypothetical protein [Legionella maioricensis]